MRFLVALLSVLLVPVIARATPAPDSVAVVANADVPGSVMLAMRYAEARQIPMSQVCLLSLPTTADMTFEELESALLAPLDVCLGEHRDRIEAVVLMRGVPIRVRTPIGTQVSVAAALGLWDSTMPDGTPVLGNEPGLATDCGGSPCTRARFSSLYRAEAFTAGWERVSGIYTHRPVLVTMLHGRSDEDAARLIEVSLAAPEETGGSFVLMSGADGARGVLDTTFPVVVSQLEAGMVSAEVVPFDRDLTGLVLAGFVTGTASLDTTIEGNTYVRGALTDNLTSFGAVPRNFEATGQSQVSIARWVAAGAAGAHGTVAEPLNNCFPDRSFLSDYVRGATLAEAYLGRMPFVYWMNLVLGDPMLAPYAERPTVAIEGLPTGPFAAASITVRGTPPTGRDLASLILYVDGEEVARSEGESFEYCLAPEVAGNVEILAVARTSADATALRSYPAAGWLGAATSVTGAGGACTPADAGALPADGGMGGADASATDAGPAGVSAGCGCHAAAPRRGMHWVLMLGLVLAVVARRRD